MIEHVAGGLQLCPRGDELVADRLVLADGLAELDAVLRIVPGFIEGGARNAKRDGADFELFDIKGAAGEQLPALIPIGFAADDGGFWQPDFVEIDVHRGGVAEIGMVDGLHRDAGGIGGDEDEAEVLVAVFGRAGADQRVDLVAPVGAGAPALGAGDDDVIALDAGAGGDAGEITADIGLGEAIGEEQLAAGQRRKEGGLLLGRAIFGEVHAAVEGGVDIGAGEAGAGAGQLLDDGDGGDDILPRAAILLRHGQRGEAELVQLGIDVARPAAVPVPLLAGVARGMGGDELFDRVAQLLHMGGFVGEGLEAHLIRL